MVLEFFKKALCLLHVEIGAFFLQLTIQDHITFFMLFAWNKENK